VFESNAKAVRGCAGLCVLGHALMETTAFSLGDKPQHVYSVRFSAREL
jgi:hypothetical protein